MNALQVKGFELLTYRSESVEHGVYVKGSGRPVLLLHELPGLTDPVVRLADRLIAEGSIWYQHHQTLYFEGIRAFASRS
jgi:hypothetical protein